MLHALIYECVCVVVGVIVPMRMRLGEIYMSYGGGYVWDITHECVGVDG